MANRTIFIDSPVEGGMADNIIHQLEVFDQQSNEDITMVISTYGGCALSCQSVVQAMNQCKSDIMTIAIGKAMSAGCVFLVNGTKGKRLATPNTQLMYHSAVCCTELGDEDMDFLRKLNDWALGELATATGKPLSEIERLLDMDAFMMPNKAVELGLIDGVLNPR